MHGADAYQYHYYHLSTRLRTLNLLTVLSIPATVNKKREPKDLVSTLLVKRDGLDFLTPCEDGS